MRGLEDAFVSTWHIWTWSGRIQKEESYSFGHQPSLGREGVGHPPSSPAPLPSFLPLGWDPVASQMMPPPHTHSVWAAQAQRPVTNFPSHFSSEVFSYLKHFLINHLSTVDEVNISFDQ